MSKYNTDNEIENMLKLVSETLSPSEEAFSKMLGGLAVPNTPKASPYTSPNSPFRFIFNSTYVRVASGFAVFVFVFGGLLSYKSKTGTLPTSPMTDVSEVATLTDTTNNNANLENDSQPAAGQRPSVIASTGRTETQSALAVASLKSSPTAPEAVDLQTALANELNAEITAQADLLALSDNI